jgi:hypothetical protein
MTNRRQLGAGAALLLSLTTACGSSDTATAPGVSPPQDETTTISSGATTIEASTTVRETTPPPSTTAAPAPTTTTTVAPITTTTTLPPPPPPAPCGVFPAIPAGALELNTAVLDAIGDGTADDTVTSYLDPGPSEWRLRLDLPVGSSSELVVTGVGPGVLKVLGAAQVDNAGADEFLAVAGAGAATQNLGAFGADSDGCLFRFDQDGATFVAPVGATVTRQDGLSCTGGGLTLGHAEEAGGGLWEVSSTTLTRISLTELSATTSSIIGGVAPGDVGNVSTLDCPGLTL